MPGVPLPLEALAYLMRRCLEGSQAAMPGGLGRSITRSIGLCSYATSLISASTRRFSKLCKANLSGNLTRFAGHVLGGISFSLSPYTKSYNLSLTDLVFRLAIR